MIELCWIGGKSSKKEAIQNLTGCSGQLLKRYFSSKDLHREIKTKDLLKLPLDLVNHLRINPIYVGPAVKIIEENDNYLAIHKPPGIHCHPLKYSDQNTILNFLVTNKNWTALEVNKDHYDRGLLYRIDFETSGILIVAKNPDFFQLMRNQFGERVKRKLYLAIVEGDFNQEGLWTHYFRATGIKGSKQKVSSDFHPDSDEAVLKVKKLATAENKSLLLVHLKTGLRHQIRAQLSCLGFPILGDELYGGKKAERLFLHAFLYDWGTEVLDEEAELFDRFFDLHSTLKVSHDVLRIF